MTQALGRHHELAKRLRALRRDAGLRRREGVFLAEGPHLAVEALASGANVDLFVVSPKLSSTDEGRGLLDRVQASGISLYEAADSVVASLQDAHSPQPVLALVRRPTVSLDDVLTADGAVPLALVLHGIQDPGNLGSMLRTADAAGATAAAVCGPGADPYHPRAVRASMGSVYRLPPIDVPTEAVLAACKSRSLVTIATAPSGGTRYDRIDLKRPLVLFIGGEGRGLPRDIIDGLDEILHVPMRRRVESLSVGAAAAVLLFEAARQRGDGAFGP